MTFLKNRACHLCGAIADAENKRYWGGMLRDFCKACEALAEKGRHPKQPENKDVMSYFERAKKNGRA